MRTTQIYIEGQLLDMFDDEQIRVNSSVQNISDISKVFTDFSQSFTVPASDRNNQILSHWYNATVTNGFVAKERKTARIDINHSTFRRGKIQLEGAEIKDGLPANYRLTFYGEVITLKDLFGDDKLSDLDYSGINFVYSYANVKDSITNTSNQDVKFPLITSDRVWEYGDASSEDISTAAGAIVWTELFPAVRAEVILEAIETTYGLSFPSTFVNNKENFVNLYFWFKNSDAPALDSVSTTDITFTGTAAPVVNNTVFFNGYSRQEIDDLTVDDVATLTSSSQIAEININTSPAGEDYRIRVYKDGNLINDIEANGSTTLQTYSPNWSSLPESEITYQISCANSGVDFTGTVEHILSYNGLDSSDNPVAGSITTSEAFDAITSTSILSIGEYAPDMKVTDWFSGLLKMFNCVCVPTSTENEFTIEPLEEWYFKGQDIDITKYVVADNIKVDRPRLYRNIEFAYQEPSSFLNKEFNDLFRRQYGNLRNFFGYDAQDFEVKLPFETILFNKFTGEDLQVAYSMDRPPDYNKLVPKCTPLYWYTESQTVSFYLNDGTTDEEITTYVPFGQDTIGFNNQVFTLNFGEEVSSFTLDPEQNSLYQRYYQRYLVNLFSDQTRLITVKTKMPLRLVNYIDLNDALIIRDQKYRINEMRSNLSNGEVEFELITDYTVDESIVFPEVGADGGTTKESVGTVKDGETIIKNNVSWITVSAGEKGPYTITDDTYITFTIAENTDFVDRVHTFEVEYYAPDGDIVKTTYITISQEAAVS